MSAGPETATLPSSDAGDQPTSPRQMRVSVRRSISIVPATSKPGSKSHTPASPSLTTSHHRDALCGASPRRNATVVRVRGHVSMGTVQRISRISRCGSSAYQIAALDADIARVGDGFLAGGHAMKWEYLLLTARKA